MKDFLVNEASGPDFTGLMWVVLEFDAAERARLLSLREVYKVVAGFDHVHGHLYALEIFDRLPVVFSRFYEPDGFEGTDPHSGWVRCSGPPVRQELLEGEYEEPRVGAMTVHVLRGGLQWEWTIKHSEESFFSATLPWSVVEDVASAQEAR